MRIFSVGLVSALAALLTSPAAKAQISVAGQTAKASFLVPTWKDLKEGPATLRPLQIVMVMKSTPKTTVVADQTEWEFNCVTRQYRIVTSSRYDWRVSLIGTTATPTAWKALTNDVAGYLSGFVCGDAKPIGPEFPNMKAAIAGLWTEAPAAP